MNTNINTNNHKDTAKFLVSFRLIFVLFSVLMLFSVSPLAEAAELYFRPQGEELGIEKNFEIKVFLNTERESINAIEGEIVFPADTLELQEIRDGASFISFWVKRPFFNGNSVIFSGILPGGYEGEQVYLFSLVFRAGELGEMTIDAKNVQVLRNEPAGSPASVTISSLKLQIKEQSSVPEFLTPYDAEPPEPFTPQIARDPTLFDEKWFLVFATQDKISGVARYFVRETTRKEDATRIDTKKWIEAESPYVLKDQKLRSYIYVKAVDKAGNERIAMLPARNQLPWQEKYLLQIISGIIIVGAIIVFMTRMALRKKYLNTEI